MHVKNCLRGPPTEDEWHYILALCVICLTRNNILVAVLLLVLLCLTDQTVVQWLEILKIL